MDLSHQRRLTGGLTEVWREFIIVHPRHDASKDIILCPTVNFQNLSKEQKIASLKLQKSSIKAQQVCYATGVAGE